MSKNEFIKRVNKQLWFLNAKEKNALNKYIDSVDQNKSIDTNKPIRFSNEYLKKFIFNLKKKSTSHVFVLLICMVLAYAFLLGLFILGLVASLAIVHAYINPNIDLSVFVMLTVLIVAIIIMIASLYAIKHTTALFTKKLLEYKFNKR
ncbi:hypothetical protein [Staphylococcus epidermidis]|uniref:hypothetical protein n=1 Tax=Staphylococcus epidermidis TaxID=1282 RepID=UPI001F2B91C3|nr:hypothetical protein [Staphylococcus epidermidis]UJA41919.1 hypothetical protein KB229_05275 [Staphylococcus epidermidis]